MRAALLLACTAAGLLGQLPAFEALLGLGILAPYTSYSYNCQFAMLAIVLGVGAGLALSGILFMAACRGVNSAWTLAGLLLIPFGASVVYAACYSGVGAVPIGSGPGPFCDPGEAIGGFVVPVLGVGMFVSGVILLRKSKPR